MDAKDPAQNKVHGWRQKSLAFSPSPRCWPRAWEPWKRFPSGAGGWKKCPPNNARNCSATSSSFAPCRPRISSGSETSTSRSKTAPDREKLRATMNRYCKWFETQPPFRRAKLLEKKKTPAERVQAVKEFSTSQVRAKDIPPGRPRIVGSWPPGWIATPRSTGPDSSKA